MVEVEIVNDGYQFSITSHLYGFGVTSHLYDFTAISALYEFVISEPAHVVTASNLILDFSSADNSMYLALFGGVL